MNVIAGKLASIPDLLFRAGRGLVRFIIGIPKSTSLIIASLPFLAALYTMNNLLIFEQTDGLMFIILSMWTVVVMFYRLMDSKDRNDVLRVTGEEMK